MKICGIYKITNTITGDFYIGSSKNIKERWAHHKCPSSWNDNPNSPMYQDMKNYGTDKFEFQVIEEVEESFLKEREQYFIETLKPTYNDRNANGWDFDKYKKYNKEYNKEYHNQLCYFNNETLTLNALSTRFRRQGISNPSAEARKYLIENNK